jgi:pimeloyl-ACP methyl ester carboxylesterase
MATYVLVHGAWEGGWSWKAVAQELQAAGHDVYRPTLTGSGERAHLSSPEIDLETHILDIVNVLRYEELRDINLVGYSYGGMVTTGVAERVPERIAHLIYLDALVPQDGESAMDLAGPEIAAAFEQAAQAYGDGWRVPHNPPDADRRVDFVIKAAQQPLAVNNPDAARIRHTYVLFTDKPADDFTKPMTAKIAARVRQKPGWSYLERPFGHWPVLDKPREVAALLLELC